MLNKVFVIAILAAIVVPLGLLTILNLIEHHQKNKKGKEHDKKTEA